MEKTTREGFPTFFVILADGGSEQKQNPRERARLSFLTLADDSAHNFGRFARYTESVKRVLKISLSRKKNRYLPKTKTMQATVIKINALKKLFKLLDNVNTYHPICPPSPTFRSAADAGTS